MDTQAIYSMAKLFFNQKLFNLFFLFKHTVEYGLNLHIINSKWGARESPKDHMKWYKTSKY